MPQTAALLLMSTFTIGLSMETRKIKLQENGGG
jgi:hypothetical protein